MHERSQVFRAAYEDACAPGGHDKPIPALMFCAQASPLSIAVAAQARADCLRKALDLWSMVGSTEVEVSDVAAALEPMAHEVQLLLAELIARLPVGSQVRA